MKFHFEFEIKKLPDPINHNHQLLLIGSCFTENIAARLRSYKFHSIDNPNGIIFNPVSVAESVISYIENKIIGNDDLFYLNEAWHSWKHHSKYSSVNVEESVNKINQSTAQAHELLKRSDYIFITLGSAWVYRLTEKASNGKPGSVAANNHKAPSDWFNRQLLSVEDVLSVLDNAIHRLFIYNPKIRIIFTISPVRHLREGVIENNRSKSILIQAVHHLCDKFEKIYYFPAYELVIDDLRDYRFYAEDLVHPNYAATQYVWEKFVDSCMNEETQELLKKIEEINRAFNHKAFNSKSVQHRKFLVSYYEKSKAIIGRYPHIDLKTEMEFFSNFTD
ncbi:MAG: GSCFA domain-containing protein [Flavisolibacter sp.]